LLIFYQIVKVADDLLFNLHHELSMVAHINLRFHDCNLLLFVTSHQFQEYLILDYFSSAFAVTFLEYGTKALSTFLIA
jgi:hypothetical protein